MRWFYYYPTFNKPSGGHKQIRLMASLLTELGIDVRLLRDRSFLADPAPFDDNQFYGVSVPLAAFPFEDGSRHLKPDDILILPEVFLEQSLSLCGGWKCRFALNNQNGFYALRYAPRRAALRSLIEFAIANAPYVAAICNEFLGIPAERIFHVPHWVVRPPFDLRGTAEGGEGRQLAVCYMPRKLPDIVRHVRDLVLQSHPHTPWVEIDGVPEAEVARRYRQSSVFFAAQDLEGCPLTALEAMACGCVVAGYPGTDRFPHPYATAGNGFWTRDRDVQRGASAVRSAIDLCRTGGPRYEQYIQAGRKTAERFAEAAVRTALTYLVDVVEKDGYRARRTSAGALGWKETYFAYKLLYAYDRLGRVGRLLGALGKATKPLRLALSRMQACVFRWRHGS